jgi:hypothetical protein
MFDMDGGLLAKTGRRLICTEGRGCNAGEYTKVGRAANGKSQAGTR